MKTINSTNEDVIRMQLARNFAIFVMGIINKNIENGGDERSLVHDLQEAAYNSQMQWMPMVTFIDMQELEKTILKRAMLEPMADD